MTRSYPCIDVQICTHDHRNIKWYPGLHMQTEKYKHPSTIYSQPDASGMLASKQYLCAMEGPIGVLRAFLWGPTHHNRVEEWKQFCAEISDVGRLRTSEGHVVSRSMQMCSITKVALTLHTRTLPYFMSGHNHGSTRSVPCNDPPR